MLPHIQLPATNLAVSAICYGVPTFGTIIQGAQQQALYDRFRAAGGNFFDTAHCYCFWLPDGDGASERAIGELVRRSGDREQVVIATKGCHPSAGAKYDRPDRYLSPEVLAADLDDSLSRLRMESIDLFYLHRDDPRLPVAEIIDMLNVEVRRGRIRFFGASNWRSERLDSANAYASTHGLQGFAASEPLWNLAENPNPLHDPTLHALDDADIHWHCGSQLPVIPYSSTAGGYFASSDAEAGCGWNSPGNRARHARAAQLAGELGCTANQISLAYLSGHSFPVIPIIGTVNLSHLDDALGATAIDLTPAQVRWLEDGVGANQP